MEGERMNKIGAFLIATMFGAMFYAVWDRSPAECARVVEAREFPVWWASHDNRLTYSDGNWYDANGVVVGVSATEDSDICIIG
jgi:hypothetical protein